MGQKARSRPERLPAKLLAIRQHLGVSQTQMIKLLESDLAYSRISEWEIGRREPNLMLLLQYAGFAYKL